VFLTLLAVTFSVAALVSLLVARLFDRPLRQILARLVDPDLSVAWHRYIIFAIYVVGIAGGVRVGSLQRYLQPANDAGPPVTLNADRWTLEIYQTAIGTLQSVAWMLLVFFVFALLAYVVVRGLETRRAPRSGPGPG
jgi:hypothetical protein